MSERIRAHRSPASLDTENTNEVLEENELLLKEGVCEPSASIIDAAVFIINKAKASALEMAIGAIGDYFVSDPIRELNELQSNPRLGYN